MEGWKGSKEGKRRERALGRKGHHPPRSVGSFMRECEESVVGSKPDSHQCGVGTPPPLEQRTRSPWCCQRPDLAVGENPHASPAPGDKLSARLISDANSIIAWVVQNTPKTGHAKQACSVTWRLGLAQACARKGHDTGEEERSSTLKDRDIKETKWHCCVDSKSA
jgi:hypothetical protein